MNLEADKLMNGDELPNIKVIHTEKFHYPHRNVPATNASSAPKYGYL